MTDPAFLEIMRSLDVDAALAYYRANNLGGPLDGSGVMDKTLARLHKERAACADLEAEFRDASEAWLAERRARRAVPRP